MNFLIRAADKLSGGLISNLQRDAVAAESYLGHLGNEVGSLKAAQRAEGWVSQGESCTGFTRQQVRNIAIRAEALYWTNSLIKRGVNIQADYVFGQSFSLTCEEPTVQEVLTRFMADIHNKGVVTEAEAAARLDVELQIQGNLFLAAYTGNGGDVHIRALDASTFEDVIRNPEDAQEVWFYHRIYTTQQLDAATGKVRDVTRTVYHPDANYRPDFEMPTIGGHEVMWDAPVFHFKPGALSGAKFGICEFYSAMTPAADYSKFLGHRMKVAEALSRFCLKFVQRGGDAVGGAMDAAAAAIARVRSGRSRAGDKRGDEENVGHAAILGEGQDMEAVNVKGATINPDDGRRMQLMSQAGFGFPETFWGDASVGTLATAQSLDRPTALKIERRRRFWADVLETLALFAVMAAIEARIIKGAIEYLGDTPVVKVNGKQVEIVAKFPDVIEADISKTIDSIDKAAKYVPDDELLAEMVLTALRVENAGERAKKLKFPPKTKEQPEADADTNKAPAKKEAPTK
jgi:hypothetical protein